MNQQPEKPNDGYDVDRLVGDLLERGSADIVDLQTLANLPPAERTRAADLLLVDALLEQLSGRQQLNLAAQLHRALDQIDRETIEPATSNEQFLPPLPVMSPQPPDRLRRLAGWLPMAIAASVLISASVFLLQPAGNQAYAAVVRAYHAALEDITREYRVTIVRNGPMPTTVPATLWVRGGSRFALKHPGPLPGNFWFGDDGQQRWLVPVMGPIVTTNERTDLLNWLRHHDDSLPFLQLSTMLGKLSRDYDVQMVGEQVRGKLRNPSTFLPQEVTAAITPSGVIRRLVLDWPPSLVQPGPRTITFELVGENTVTDDWFSHKAHHDPRRPVIRVPRMSAD